MRRYWRHAPGYIILYYIYIYIYEKYNTYMDTHTRHYWHHAPKERGQSMAAVHGGTPAASSSGRLHPRNTTCPREGGVTSTLQNHTAGYHHPRRRQHRTHTFHLPGQGQRGCAWCMLRRRSEDGGVELGGGMVQLVREEEPGRGRRSPAGCDKPAAAWVLRLM
jgi:hypothetical protein